MLYLTLVSDFFNLPQDPNLLQLEKAAYQAKGYNVALNEGLFQKGLVVFEGTVSADDGDHFLHIVYPPGFPDIAPEVLDVSKVYARHQNPHDRNLCLPDDWNDSKTGADRVTDAISLFNIFHSSQDAIMSQETDAPEPASHWYHYTPHSTILIPSDFTRISENGWGSFTVAIPNYQDFRVIHTVLLTVEDVATRQNTTPKITGGITSGIRLSGTWMRSQTPPPYNITDFEAFREWCISINSKYLYRMERAKQPALSELKRLMPGSDFELFGVVFKEEYKQRYNYHDQWLVGLKIKSPRGTYSGILRPSMLGTDIAYFDRIPDLNKMQYKHAVFVGLGAVGGNAAIELARAGLGSFTLIDPDIYDAGNVVRQPGNLLWSGHLKVSAIASEILLINPQAKINIYPYRLGSVISPREYGLIGVDNITHFSSILPSTDIVISSVGDQRVEFIINRLCVKASRPAIFSSVYNGAWSGFSFLAEPEGACLMCYGFHKEDGALTQPSEANKVSPLYARGCSTPTFTGAGFDCSIIANITARLAAQKLLQLEQTDYHRQSCNLLHWTSMSVEGIHPDLCTLALQRHPKCWLHK